MAKSVHTIPSDYLLGLVDVSRYESYLGEAWTLASLSDRLLREMNAGRILCWGTGASGNWKVRVARSFGEATGFREFTATIHASSRTLHLTSYDELTVVAQFKGRRLSSPGSVEVDVGAAGAYDCRIVQLFDPASAESEEVFHQKTPHFVVEIRPAPATAQESVRSIPWFPDGAVPSV